ncbi:sugar-binding protein [Tautonia sociabilis]|uniref:Carbohydrate-binding domain-containing protein n=1 Tax=Tautonia sociabilis TaxID=2080755 RepID=A0A432MEW0_9BACT|nr:sugar-binding protein [Tautonia sociabilis]RUL84229.1 hypothetical protein TsocGM_20785 [Tautonia sociabilis]
MLTLPMLALLLPASPADDPPPVPEPRGYVASRAPGPITIDGLLDDPGWEGIPWTETFVDIEGDVKPLPRFQTRAKMAWDDRFFYIAADLEEPHVWGTLTEHDSVIFRDNDFEVFIDPDGDNHQYYEFEINALNTGWDLRLVKPYRDGGPALNEWEIPGLKTAVHVRGTLNDSSDEDDGWSVEIAMPWSVLSEFTAMPCPPRDGDRWRVNFSRVEWLHRVVDGTYQKVPDRREDNWVWSPQGVIDMHRPERWGDVQFSTAPPGTVAFQPDPARPARDFLHRVYEAQKSYHREHGRFAESFEELGIDPAGWTSPQLETTGDGYTASVIAPGEEGEPPRRWTIRQDSLLTSGPAS